MIISIIGAGGFGTAIAKILGDKGYAVKIWAYESEVAKEINGKKTNSKFLPNIKLPENIIATTSLKEALENTTAIFLITPSTFLINIARDMKKYVKEDIPISCLTKGFLEINRKPTLILDALKTIFPNNNLAYVSGPTHAEEIANNVYSGIVVSSKDKKTRHFFDSLISNGHIRVHRTTDIVGAQTGAALKNIIAIFYGILDALKNSNSKVGDNTESYLYSRGLVEIQRIAVLFGEVKASTFLGLTGAGDLLVTCSSIHGRNRRFGLDLIEKKLLKKHNSLDEILNSINYLPEGVYAIREVMKIKGIEDLRIPLIKTLWDILNNKIEPVKAIEEYMAHEEYHI
ncbi:MAG: NAD(P)H-dependent glycerol-3-phosphate dehydrogenase [Nanoarchaeota archaeon]